MMDPVIKNTQPILAGILAVLVVFLTACGSPTGPAVESVDATVVETCDYLSNLIECEGV